MKKFRKWFGFMIAAMAIVLSGGSAYAMADDPAIQNPVGALDGPGTGVAGDKNMTEAKEIMENQVHDLDYYQKQINKHIVEMKLESCPVDQILRSSAKSQKSHSVIVKYYEIGQRPIRTVLNEAINATSNGTANAVKPLNNTCFDSDDTIMFPGIMGYKEDGVTRETLKPLMVRVVGQDVQNYPMVIAVNGKKNAGQGNNWDLPDIPKGAAMLRLGRAATEKDVETASYYNLPDPSIQYCQRFIMQAEESIIERMSAKVVDWDFSKQERIAMDDMRDGMERSGLFGIRSVTRYGKMGNVYTTGGIYWLAGKDIQLGCWIPKTVIGSDGKEHVVTVEVQDVDDGHLLYTCQVSAVDTVVYTTDGGTTWKDVTDDSTVVPDDTPEPKMVEKTVYEYAITEEQLHEFVRLAIKNAGNGSRTKLLFVDDLIYKAFSNLKSKRRIITQTENNYQNWGLDFESFNSMGTKIMIYRHDAFNYMGMSGCAFLLDPRYLEKWIFGDWSRKEYDLEKLFIRKANAVVMEEFSCWTLYFPSSHARVFRPDFDPTLGVTDELDVA